MATISFTCPNCNKVLKTGNPIPAGKKVKCPGCATIFPMPAQEEEEDLDTIVQSTTSPAPKRTAAPPPPPPDEDDEHDRQHKRRRPEPADDDEDEEAPRKRRRPEPDDEDEAKEAPRKSRKGRAYDDDEEDEEEDDRPRRRKSKKKKAASKLPLIIGLAGAGLVLLLVALTAFVWPGFLLSGGPSDLLAFVPDKSDVVAGANLTALRSRPGSMQQIDQMGQMMNLNPARVELIKTADRGIAAAVKNTNQTVVAFNSQNPFDPGKVRQALNGGPAETIEGKVIHPIQADFGKSWFSMLNGKTVVVGGNMEKTDFLQILKGQNKLSANLQNQVASLGKSGFWFALDLQGGLKGDLQQLPAAMLGIDPKFLEAVRRSPSVSFAVDITQGAKMQLGLQCANDADAAQVETEVNKLKGQLQGLNLLALQVPELKGFVDDVVGSFKVEKQGAKVLARVEVTENALKDMEKIQAGNLGLPFIPVGAKTEEVLLQNNLKQIALAIHNARTVWPNFPSPAFGGMPPQPRLNLSWRVAIMPFFEESNLQFKMDEPWDSPNNIKLLEKVPRLYAPVGKQPKGNVKGGTYIQLVTGPGTSFPTKTTLNLGLDIPDGTSNTILFVEAGTMVPWTKPDDVEFKKGLPLPKLGALNPNGFYAAMWDGSVRFIDRRKISDETILQAINPKDGLPSPGALDK